MICHSCGAQLSENANFCRQCGTAVTPVLDHTPPPQPPVEVSTIAVKPKKRRTGLIIGICTGVFALLLAIVLLAGRFFLDWFKEADDDTKRETGSQQEDEDDDTSSDKIKLKIKEADLVYELTDDDVEAYYELLDSTEKLAIKGKDEDAIREAHEELEDHFDYLKAQHSIAAVLHYCDLEDTDASDLYLSCTETITEVNDEYLKMCRRVYESNSPAKDVFFEEWTDLDMKLLMSYTDEVVSLVQRNSEIQVEYQKLQDESDMYEAMVPLYIELVQNNNRIAEIYGYNSYYEYAYEVEYLRDYEPEQVDVMRNYVVEYIPDAYDDVSKRFQSNLNDLSTKERSQLIDTLLDSYEKGDNKDYIVGYLSTLPKQARKDMLDMFNGNILIMEDAHDAMEGAFTSTIGKDRQVCFFGPNYNNLPSLIHEVGHYYGGTHQYLEDLPLDLAETQSQGNEWLFLKYLEDELSEDVYQTMVDYQFVNDMGSIILCVIIDEFEQQVYTHPNIDTLTSDDLDQIMEDVCLNYGGINYLSTNIADVQQYWRQVVVEQPVYYVSYAVSAIASIDLYITAMDDYDEAVDIYQDLIENVDLDEGFLGNITAAGLSSPFDKRFYKQLSELISD